MDNSETQALDSQGRPKVGVPPPPDLPAELLATVIADVESRSSIVFDHTLQFKKQFRQHCRGSMSTPLYDMCMHEHTIYESCYKASCPSMQEPT